MRPIYTYLSFKCHICGNIVINPYKIKPRTIEDYLFFSKQHTHNGEHNCEIILNRGELYPLRAMMLSVTYGNDKSLVGVEIGTRDGNNALSILLNMNIKKLYLIDPYKYYDGYDGHDLENAKKSRIECRMKLNHFKQKGKVELIIKKSEDAVNDIPNNLDFVYID